MSEPDARATRFVLWMGVVALFGDLAYEGARSITGPYLDLLGASAVTVAVIAGAGELAGFALRVASGWLAERTRAYWSIVAIGYAINLVAIPGLALAGRWEVAAGLIVLERIGKALRSPSKATLVSHAASRIGAGKAFAIDEALDQIGAVAGPLLVMLAMWLARGSDLARHRYAFAALGIAVILNLGALAIAKRMFPAGLDREDSKASAPRVSSALVRRYLIGVGLLGFGFADWALVAYHAAHANLVEEVWVPALYALAMAVDALAALAFGALFDRFGVRSLALAALVSAISGPLVFLAPSAITLVLGAIAWAIAMGAQDSVYKAAIATLVPAPERPRAYGLFFGVFGLAWFAGSALLGVLYGRSLLALAIASAAAPLLAIPFLFWTDFGARARGAS
jgi:MFS family permease